MKHLHHNAIIILVVCFLLSPKIWAQPDSPSTTAPNVNDFAGTLSFLSSDWMEGREAGARGGFMAADYIASMMQQYGLIPSGDPDNSNTINSNRHGNPPVQLQTYFQNFEVIRYKTDKATVGLISRTPSSQSALQLSHGIDFELLSGRYDIETEAPLVFAGYGIAAADQGYDNYSGLNVKDRIVVVLDGFPGHADTTSIAWRRLGKYFSDGHASLEQKLQTASKYGALALIVVSASNDLLPSRLSARNLDVVNSAMTSAEKQDQEYDDHYYCLPGDTAGVKTPIIIMGLPATDQLFSGTGIVLTDYERKMAREMSPVSLSFKDKRVKISADVSPEVLVVRNVVGCIRGRDSTKSIVVGAHYDHLGVRNGLIYHGADDNASGTSGMLALARKWSEFVKKPACNIIFAAWTAEEKGLLGSNYFVQHTRANPDQTLLYVNMDMISRSARDDTAHRILSIGTLTGSDRLKQIARENNLRLSAPFQLDLWDVTGHSGSDYGSFIAVKIPVMTFFSGFHEDYHSPRDVVSKVDLQKMGNILKLVNGCIQEFAGNPFSE